MLTLVGNMLSNLLYQGSLLSVGSIKDYVSEAIVIQPRTSVSYVSEAIAIQPRTSVSLNGGTCLRNGNRSRVQFWLPGIQCRF